MTDAEARDLPLADVLSVTTGRLLSRDGMAGVYRALQYLTGDPIMTHQIPRALDACCPKVLEQHPQLLDVAPGADAEGAEIGAWLTAQERRFGLTLPLAPIDGWEHRDPVAELVEMMGPERVIPVVIEP